MNCQFCYTGRMGLLGNLKTAQIVEQVVEARRFLAEEGGCGGVVAAGAAPATLLTPSLLALGLGSVTVVPSFFISHS